MFAFKALAVGADFLIMDDNVRAHRSNLVDEIVENEDIHQMDCPARSPDLIIIKHNLRHYGGQLELATLSKNLLRLGNSVAE
ncbi:hypothetical protein TNCV_192191 [Trichonephila clavipes]|nr:hypothetical protein TNCV_192191 [Trichonephila clavipes]